MEERYLLQLRTAHAPIRYQEILATSPAEAVRLYRKEYGGEMGIQVIWKFVS